MRPTDGQERPALRFRPDGTFKILQISDVQDSNGVRQRTKELLAAALDRESPDFVVFTGDQIKGNSIRMLLGGQAHRDKHITKTLDELLALVEERQIPFTFTFGNHDHDAPIDGAELLRYYQQTPLCLAQASPAGVPGFANHAIPVAGSRDDAPALLLYCLDSHNRKGATYLPLAPEQVAWYRETRDAYAKVNGGHCVPSLLFQHVPVEEIITLYRIVPKGTPGAFPGIGNFKGHWYALDPDKVVPGGFMGELPSSPAVNAGLFEAAREKGDMAGMFFGHDHTNGFHGVVQGIVLAYAPGAGTNAYGPGRKRGVRVIRLREEDPMAFETELLTDEMLLGPGKALDLYTRLYDKTPTGIAAAIPMFAHLGLWLLALALSIAAGVFAAGRLGSGWLGAAVCAGGFAVLAAIIELIYKLKK